MYSKLFATILDSSIWLEDSPTRVVWLTFLAAKDGDGFARFAAMENLARRAVVSLEEAQRAVAILEAPDKRSSNPDHDGRRIERVPGGWMVLNAKFYDELTRQEDQRRATRERVQQHRDRKRAAHGQAPELGLDTADPFDRAWALYPKRGGGNSKASALRQWRARLKAGVRPEDLIAGVERYALYIRAKGDEGTEFVKQAATFFGRGEHWKEAYATNGRARGREAQADRAIDEWDAGAPRGK